MSRSILAAGLVTIAVVASAAQDSLDRSGLRPLIADCGLRNADSLKIDQSSINPQSAIRNVTFALWSVSARTTPWR
jgi:hypothetical protein